MSMLGIVRTPVRRKQRSSRTPDLKPATPPSLPVAGLQVDQPQKGTQKSTSAELSYVRNKYSHAFIIGKHLQLVIILEHPINVSSDLQKMMKTTHHLKWIFEFKRADVIFVTLLLALLLTPTISSASNHELNDELGVIHQHIGFLMDENQNQNHEIALLKQMVERQLNDHHADSIIISNDDKQHHSADKKRPARLLPFRYLYGEKNDTDLLTPPRFHGPPTNCSDLSKLGYTLNGFYLVKRPNAKFVDLLQLESIFCAFKQPTEGITFDLASVLKKKTPISNSWSSGIHFYALKSESSPSQSTIITFEMTLLNMGKAFDPKTSIFSVPISGVYQFIFRGALINSQYGVSKNKKNNEMELEPERISFMVNDRVVGAAADNAESPNLVAFSVMIEATLKLNRGDRVYLKPKRLSLMVAVGGNYENCTSFSGSLLIAEEDN